MGGRALLEEARQNNMLRDLRSLNVGTATQQELNNATAAGYDPSNDYIEEIPPAAKRWRRQNLVHFDIDPQNSMSYLLPIIHER